jgi:hypothetical protein
MLDLNAISDEIAKIEAGPTTLEACQKLAFLLTVFNNYQPEEPAVVVAESDLGGRISGQLSQYIETKRKYHKIKSDTNQYLMLDQLSQLLDTVNQVYDLLWQSSDCDAERELIVSSRHKI